MSYIEEISKYIDQDNLIGNCIDPTPGTDGNPIVLAAVSSCINNEYNDLNVSLINGVVKLESLNWRGIWNKKARSTDQVTHDDLIGLVCFSRKFELDMHKWLYNFGYSHNWIMSNTGLTYFTAIAKPWHRVFYTVCAGRPVNFLSKWLLNGFLLSVIYNGGNSGKQLGWLMVNALDGLGFDWIVDKFKKNVDMSKVLKEFHGEQHPFYRYYRG